MGFFRSFKEKFSGDDHERQDDLNPQGGPNQNYQTPEIDNYDNNTTRREKQQVFGSLSSALAARNHGPADQNDRLGSTKHEHQHSEYDAPFGPPPSHQQYGYQSEQQQQQYNTNPPPYQDPYNQEQQSEHQWRSIPDTADFPPPPAVHAEFSPANNASEDSAEAGRIFCENNPIYMPAMPRKDQHDKINISGEIILQVPSYKKFQGKFKKESLSSSSSALFRSSLSTRTITRTSSIGTHPSVSKVHRVSSAYTITSQPGADDICFITELPLYFAKRDNPLLLDSSGSSNNNLSRQQPKEIAFGIKILTISSDANAVIGIGFVSKPYPPFRQPGWHRGSFGIHADDGRRYVNDPDGGIDFVRPFQDGDLILVTLIFHPDPSPLSSINDDNHNNTSSNSRSTDITNLPKCRSRVEFERNGVPEGGWDMHEERDAERPGIQGLQGESDLYAAVGVCGGCTFEVLFWPQGS